MWNQWPVGAVPSAPISAPPQPSVPPPLPDVPPPPPPSDPADVSAGVSGTGTTTAGYMAPVAAQTTSNPYDQYTAAQYAAMTPEQQYALQQHWQQWQTYQQDYAKWHAQYGEQYKREMAAAAAAAAAAATTVPTVAPTPVAAPVPVPAIGTVYPQAQLVPQMTVQPHVQTYLPQPAQPQSQSQLPGKIMAQPQMYNQPPPPPPKGYQLHPQPQELQRHQQSPSSNQWRPQPPPGRFNQVPPVNYNQAPNLGDPNAFPNLQQPPPAFMSQPPLSSANQIDASWAKEQNINEADQRKRWDGHGPLPDVGRHQQQQGPPHNNRWQSIESNSKNKSGNKSNQFGNRRNWQNNPPGSNKTSNNRNNPFSSAAPSHYGSDSDNSSRNFRDDAVDPDDCNSNASGGIGRTSYSINGPGQGPPDNFGSGAFENNGRGGKNNIGGRWEHNRHNQSGGNFGPSHDSNSDGGYNRAPNPNNFNQQQQRAPDLDEASFDRLFDQWEKQFEDWKRANANHPDRDEYRRYEEEFEKQRRRIAERREQMRRRRQMQNPQQVQQQARQQPYSRGEQEEQSGNSGLRYEEDANRSEQNNRGNTPKDLNINQRNRRISETDSESERGISSTYKEKELENHQSQPSSEKETVKSATPTPSPKFRNEQKQPQLEVEKNKRAPNILGKRKPNDSANMGATSIPAKNAKQDNILIISLDDDDDDAESVQKQQADKKDGSAVYTPMKNIFQKTDGIPGLDLVADGKAAVPTTRDVGTASRSTDASSSDSNKKIPSLFDVVIAKPSTEVINDTDKEPATARTSISETLPDDVTQALKDPEFMNNLSQALAQAQGRDREQQQQQPQSNEHCGNNNSSNINNDCNSGGGRPMSFAEWQRKKNNQQDEEPMNSFDAGPGNGPGNRGGYGAGSGGGFGPDQQQQQQGYGPNGPGPGDFQLMGPNFTDFTGPSHGNFGPSGPPYGPNFGPRSGYGPNPGQFGGPGHNGPFGRNFGPGGPNNPNFMGPGPNFNDRGPNFGPNFRNNGSNPAVFRPNFCGPNGPGPGPNFGNPARFSGPGSNNNSNDRNFGLGTNNPIEHNFGPGPNNSNKRNFGSAHNSSNFMDPNMGNNKNIPFVDNPFRRNGGPQVPNIDDSLRDGPDFEPRGKGQLRSTFGNVGNKNKPWADGAESFGNPNVVHPNESSVYRPMQVFDYQNSRNTAAKVIDYGHKSADIAATRIGSGGPVPEFRPVNTFDYGHASHNAVLAGPGEGPLNRNANTNNNRKKNKKKNKNRQRLMQQQQQQHPQQDQQEEEQQQQEQQQEQQEQPQSSSMSTNIKPNAAEQSCKPDDLEDISDGEDNLADATRFESPPPSPPKINKDHLQQSQSRKAFPANPQRRMLSDPPVALFPSTATANRELPDHAADTHRLEISVPTNENRNTISIDEVLLPPGRLSRPKRVCIILRGPPGSGKSYVARLIKDKELEMGGASPRLLSIDDYFIIENDYEEKCPKTGKKIPKKEILYEYDDTMEETYMQYLIKSFKKTLSDNLYDFIIVDCNNNSLRTLNEFYCHAKDSNFVPYIIDLRCDVETCLGRNIHQRSEKDIRAVLDNWCTTPLHYIKLDVSTLLENVVEMEDVENMATDDNATNESAAPEDADNVVIEEEDSNSADAVNDCGFLKSKWENDTTEENLARLDGTNRLIQKRKAASMAEFLQLDDWEPPASGADGKKRVRWADIEEKRAQQKMRAIGFVVGQTDWKRMMDPNAGNRALNKTKYIERVKKRR